MTGVVPMFLRLPEFDAPTIQLSPASYAFFSALYAIAWCIASGVVFLATRHSPSGMLAMNVRLAWFGFASALVVVGFWGNVDDLNPVRNGFRYESAAIFAAASIGVLCA